LPWRRLRFAWSTPNQQDKRSTFHGGEPNLFLVVTQIFHTITPMQLAGRLSSAGGHPLSKISHSTLALRMSLFAFQNNQKQI
jgi:hypothetical protein